MDYAQADEGLPDISICPRCGARLVTRNLSHSCGTFTLEGLFPRSEPAVLDLARKYVAMLYGETYLGTSEVQDLARRRRWTTPKQTRDCPTSASARDAEHGRLDSPRIIKTEDYGPRWRIHFVTVRDEADLDDELRAWLQESHDVVGMQSDLRSE